MGDQISILYAEDDLAHVVLTRRIFESLALPCFIRHFENGKELVAHLMGVISEPGPESLKNTILLIDLKMPVMDGVQALEVIKNDARLKDLPSIIFTTSNAPKEMERCQELGCDGYFIKSFSAIEIRKLFNLIKEVLSRKN